MYYTYIEIYIFLYISIYSMEIQCMYICACALSAWGPQVCR